jgi:hypothetical protein
MTKWVLSGLHFGNPAHSESPVALRPSLARGLPFGKSMTEKPFKSEQNRPEPNTGNLTATERARKTEALRHQRADWAERGSAIYPDGRL